MSKLKRHKTAEEVMSYYTKTFKKRGIKPLTEEEKRKRERAMVDTHRNKGLQRRAETKKPTTPPTAAQIRSQKAAERRARYTKGTPIERLTETLRKKED